MRKAHILSLYFGQRDFLCTCGIIMGKKLDQRNSLFHLQTASTWLDSDSATVTTNAIPKNRDYSYLLWITPLHEQNTFSGHLSAEKH